jgi:hypothetical protein
VAAISGLSAQRNQFPPSEKEEMKWLVLQLLADHHLPLCALLLLAVQWEITIKGLITVKWN